MTQEEKQLLLKVLCGMLPYGVKVNYKGLIRPLFSVSPTQHYQITLDNAIDGEHNGLEFVSLDVDAVELNPYLRPLSSMTEEEMDKLFDILHIDKDGNDEDWIKINDALGIKFFFPTGKWIENVAEAYDYLNSIHIDYRGMIPIGLALEAPKDMYIHLKTERNMD